MDTTSHSEVPAVDRPTEGTAAGRRRRGRRWVRPVVYLATFYAAWCGTLYFYQDHLIFPAELAPEPLPRPLPKQISSKVVVCRLDVPGGESEAWFCPAPGVSPDRPGPAVVFFHGNAELIDYQDDVVQAYHRLGVSVLLPEYRGYGVVPGEASQKAILEDNVRFYDWLVQRPEVDAKRIVFHGRSVGGGVACDLATQREPEAMVLESTFISAASLAHRYLAPEFLCRHPFRNDRALRQTRCPVLIGHGGRDTIIPVAHGRTLRDLEGRGVVYIEYDCGHNDFPGMANQADWWRRIGEFLVWAKIIPATGRGSRPAAGE